MPRLKRQVKYGICQHQLLRSGNGKNNKIDTQNTKKVSGLRKIQIKRNLDIKREETEREIVNFGIAIRSFLDGRCLRLM